MYSATTPEQIELFRITVIIRAMELFLETGIKVSRQYTLTNMVRAAEDITGQKFTRSRKGLAAAMAALISMREELHVKIQG